MSKRKRRKRPSRPASEPAASAAAAASDGGGELTSSDGDARIRRRRPSAARESRAPTSGSTFLQPPLLPSLAAGLALVASTPMLLATAFLGAFGLWALLSAFGAELVRISSPAFLGQLEALPPMHSLLDFQVLFAGSRLFSGTLTFVFGVSLILIRAALAGFLISLTLYGFEEGYGAPGRALRSAARRTATALPALLALEAGSLGVILLVPTVLGAIFGQLGGFLALLGAMYFFAYAPIAVIDQRAGLGRSLQLSIRAARARGPRHMVLTFGYVTLSFVLIFSTQGRLDASATPTFLLWTYTLFMSFIQISILAMFVHRWSLLREAALATPTPRPAREPRLPLLGRRW